tara:strand:+ start:250 stop:909 length:660 start_codon:yes stop_codon:yes gene_type:complete
MNLYDSKKKKYLLHGGLTEYTLSEKNLFKTDHIGLFSLTSAKIAKELSDNIISLFPDNYPIHITDATASVGGNTIPFLLIKNFAKVNTIELDKNRYDMLKYNINIKKQFIIGAYDLYNCSYLNIKNDFNEDIIFIDPPWGGPDYYKETNINLFLDNIPLVKIINSLFTDKDKLKYVLIKTPKNFDLNDFITNMLNKLFIEKLEFSKNLKKINFFIIKII